MSKCSEPECRRLVADLLRAACFGLALVLCFPAHALETVRLQLKWQHQFQFAGYYAAQAQGYYRDVGLDVVMDEATPGLDVIEEVVSGRAQYGVGSSSLLLARQAGKPVVALAVIYQHSPLVLLTRADAEIGSIHDLAGKRVMLEPQSEELIAYMRREGLAPGKVTVLPHSFNPKDLINGRVAAISAYSTDEAFFLQQAGLAFQVYSPRSAGIDFYGDNLFTSEAEIRAHPERVKAFREASLKGWKYALQHQEEVIELILSRYGERHGREYLRYEAVHTLPLLQPELVELGYMYPGRWQHIASTYAELGLLPERFSLEGFLYPDPRNADRLPRRWLVAFLSGALLIGCLLLITVLVVRLNRRLQREIAARQEVSAELHENEQRFRFIAENSADVIWTLDLATNRFSYVSPSVFRLRGLTAEEVMAEPVTSSVTPESAERIQQALGRALSRWDASATSPNIEVTEVDQTHKDGRIIHTEVVTTLHAGADGKPAFVLGVTRDITERKKTEALIRDLAFLDPLTRLPNRRLLLDRLQQAIARARREDGRLALMFVDLDRFKPINDLHGHAVGDALLEAVAQRMQGIIRESDTVARLGGDEFVVLLPTALNEADALALGDKLRAELLKPFVLDEGLVLTITASIGIAFFPEHGQNEEQLLRNGDAAMYQSKENGRNRVQVLSGSGFAESTAALLSVRLRWKKSYECGEDSIDREHRQLFELANALINAAQLRDTQPQTFRIVLEELLSHVLAHFENEEKLLAQSSYPELAAHAREHQRLIDRALNLQTEALAGGVSMGALVDFLANEVVGTHMLQEDRRFFHLFAAKPA